MPSAEAVEMVLTAVPGVERAHVEADADAQGSLRIRVAEGYDARIVAEEVSSTLWDRFSIELPPESLLRQPAEPVSARSPVASLISGGSDTVVLYDAAEEQARTVMDADLPGWDDVLVRAQRAAEAGESRTEGSNGAAATVEIPDEEATADPTPGPEPVQQIDLAAAEVAVATEPVEEPPALTAAEAAAIPGPVLPPIVNLEPDPPVAPVPTEAPTPAAAATARIAPAPEPTTSTPVLTLEEPTMPATATSAADVRLQTSLPSEPGHRDIRIVDATIEGAGLGRRAVVVVHQSGPSGDHAALGATLVDGNEAFAIAAATLQAIRNLD